MNIIEIDDLHFTYPDGTRALRGVSLSVTAGQSLGLIGPNGVGKTTLLRALARLLEPRDGQVFLGDRDIWRLRPRAVAQSLALTPQDTPNWPLTVEQVVALGRAPHRGWLLPLSSRDTEIVERALQRTELGPLRQRQLTELSGGEQKRVILARALCQQPRVLLLDEPTTHLDLKYQVEILTLVRDLAHEDGLTVVVTMHDLNQAALHSDRLALLVRGRVLAIGPPVEVLTEANLTEAYGVPVLISEHPVYHTPLVTPLAAEPSLSGTKRLREPPG